MTGNNMTQEEKEKNLLLKDLCSRLLYKPVVHVKYSYRETDGTIKYKNIDRKLEINDFYAIWNVKPYLRSLSNMTEEEKETYQMFFNEDGLLNTSVDTYVDWLLEGYFDFRGLIPMGLALEAREGMYIFE